MESYIEVIKIAFLVFPFLAFLMSVPFILIQYHRYGSISFFKALMIYSFALYLLCAYFLVILPLPKISEVALLTTPRTQFIPFKFVTDFISQTSFRISDIHTYLIALKESCFYVPLYNIFLTLPFGIYLRYYFKCDKKRIVLYTFLLSMFFELTQLSGLYFIYPRGYRLFDVDDLILNTFGGLLGYVIAKPLLKILPKTKVVDEKTKEKGKIVSGFRRTTCLCLDFFLFLLLQLSLEITFSSKISNYYILGISIFVYYFLIPSILKCSTLGEKFLKIQVQNEENVPHLGRYYLRNIIFMIIYIGIPFAFGYLLMHFYFGDILKEFIGVIFLGFIFLLYMISGIKYLFTNKRMLYEKLSKTHLGSTIK